MRYKNYQSPTLCSTRMSLLPDKKTILSEYVKFITETVATFMQSKNVDVGFHQKFKNLLEISTTCNDNSLRIQAENEIEAIRQSADPKAHVVSILQVLFLLDKEETSAMTHYITYLSSYIRRFANHTIITDEAHLQMLACIVCVIINKEIPSSLRGNLSYCFELLLGIEGSPKLDLIKLSVGVFVNNSLHQLAGFQMIGALFIIRILLNKVKDEQEYYAESSRKVILIATTVLPEAANLDKADPAKIAEILKIFGLSVDICYKIIVTYSELDANPNLNPIVDEIVALFDKILLMDFFKTGNSLICFHSDEGICDTVNSIKHNVMRGFSKLAQANYKKKPEEMQLDMLENVSPVQKKLHSFYGNLVRYLLKQIYLAMKMSADRGIVLANDVINLICK